ncbi:MAG: carbon-nitrogen hydrolase [Planctomycetes bacterium]|nr:carbon-nitrogen hydrolase [Planctomycetota bacterium]
MPSRRAGESVVRLGLVQHASPGVDKAKNLAKATALIRDAARKGAQVVATQELFLTHYFCQVESDELFKLAEPIPGPSSQKLCDLAKKLRIHLTASLFEKRAPGVFHNTSLMINPAGKIIGKYRKMHIPDDPRFFEKYYFTPGDAPGKGEFAGWQTQTLELGKSAPRVTTGMLICWDQWYPEAARLTALRGAKIIFYPTAIGWYHKETPFDRKQQREAWHTVQRAHAIANGVFVAAINRVGTENDLEFWGGSFIADPGGVIIAEAPQKEECTLVADCDLKRVDEIRLGWPFFRDRRIDAYEQITRRIID